ncbi:MAG: hypothetical protein PWP23_145 [Candidatus Sumerlaeota bacterium]|nr:hypothetical protein [Candidatus Sumerlaeota bacterium]
MVHLLWLKKLRTSMLFAALLLAASAASAIPSNFTISGVLKDTNGQFLPDAYSVATQVVFYGSETSETALETVTTACNIRSGLFSARIYFPISLLSQDELWYTLALDTDGNGLDANDVFAERFYISAVPFSINSQPATIFSTHGGWIPGAASGSATVNRVEITPFITPSSGVVFDVAVMKIGAPGHHTVNVAIYDSDGNMVQTTNPFIAYWESAVAPYNGNTFALPLVGALEPSKVYYVAFVTSSSSTGLIPTQQIIWPYGGNQEIFTSNATLPATFDVQTAKMGVGFNLTLMQTDESKAGRGISERVGTSKEGLPIYAPLAQEDPSR